ncbi:hypothetical protein Nepgr_029709 [Nepenthes gracilis]|uniref:Uncharacterized protein n=1 Tax=Nepenthes gracilis TaxID=150966 RepID=A0AAD3TET6_NEPGR|nr:hypothetical protein Nepgr_029709 [Nepenthes gracilis]
MNLDPLTAQQSTTKNLAPGVVLGGLGAPTDLANASAAASNELGVDNHLMNLPPDDIAAVDNQWQFIQTTASHPDISMEFVWADMDATEMDSAKERQTNSRSGDSVDLKELSPFLRPIVKDEVEGCVKSVETSLSWSEMDSQSPPLKAVIPHVAPTDQPGKSQLSVIGVDSNLTPDSITRLSNKYSPDASVQFEEDVNDEDVFQDPMLNALSMLLEANATEAFLDSLPPEGRQTVHDFIKTCLLAQTVDSSQEFKNSSPLFYGVSARPTPGSVMESDPGHSGGRVLSAESFELIKSKMALAIMLFSSFAYLWQRAPEEALL